MKKIILSFITLTSFFSLSAEMEANIKVGYDFYRSSTVKDINNSETIKYGRGFVIGVELLPFTFKNEIMKLGVGIEYNFGETTLKYSNIERKLLAYYPLLYPEYMVPLYATAKWTYYRPKNIDLNLYTFGRLGYAFAKEYSDKKRYKETGGIYYGLGFGIDYKYFLAEILYDGKYKGHYKLRYINYETDFHHKVGVRLGVQLGTQHFKKVKVESPKIVEKVVEKKITNKTIIKKFDISAKVLFEFNKYKLEDLKENGKKEIDKKVKELLKPGFKITEINVIGHTDILGKEEYNYNLGLNRANTIAEYLKELGIEVEIKSISMGETRPKVYCDNNIKPYSKLRECLQPNRRVEIQFIGLETQQKEEVAETGD